MLNFLGNNLFRALPVFFFQSSLPQRSVVFRVCAFASFIPTDPSNWSNGVPDPTVVALIETDVDEIVVPAHHQAGCLWIEWPHGGRLVVENHAMIVFGPFGSSTGNATLDSVLPEIVCRSAAV